MKSMEPQAIVEAVEASEDRSAIRNHLRKHGQTPETNRAFFLRIAELLGTDTARAASLARHHDLFLRFGDEPAWAHRARGVAERFSGQWAKSAASFRAAGKAAGSQVDRLAFQVGAVDSLARAGDVPAAVQLGKRLSKGLRNLGETELAAKVELNTGNALVWSDRYQEARNWYQKAIPHLRGSELAMVKLGLSTAELFGGHPQVARTLATEALTSFTELEQTYSSDLCSINLVHEAILRGRADEALAKLSALKIRFADAPAFDQIRLEEFSGDAYLALNLSAEAETAFRSALSHAGIRRFPLNHANCTFGLALAHKAEGRWSEAITALRAAQRRYRRSGNDVWLGMALVEEADALIASGSRKRAGPQVASAINKLKAGRSGILLTRAELLDAKRLIQSRKDPSARLRSAHRLIRKYGLLSSEWQVHALRAESATGSSKLRHWKTMVQAIAESRRLTRSVLAQSSYLQDKQEALAGYLGFLMRRGTRRDVDEALEVVSQLRSTALLDEILSARGVLSAEQLSRLEELRGEIGSALGTDAPSGPMRRAATTSAQLIGLQRRWIETSLRLEAAEPTGPQTNSRNIPTMLECGEDLYFVRDPGRVKLPLQRSQLRNALQWLQFELFAPLTDPSADGDCLKEALDQLRDDLIVPWSAPGQDFSISPDGLGWAVPWQTLSESEPTILLTPNLSPDSGRQTLQKPKRVVVWYHAPPDLPHISLEVEAILSRYPNAEICTSSQEARKAVQEGHIDLLHVATHARINGANPMFSSLEFDDGPYLAAELAQCGATFGLVVLSACETGTFSLRKRHEPDGLVRSFLARSAAGVIGSSWLLDDESASIGFERFYARLAEGKSWIDSLRDARAAMRLKKPHPFYWGALVFYGGYCMLEGDRS